MSKPEFLYLMSHPSAEEIGRSVFAGAEFGEEHQYGVYVGQSAETDILRDGPEDLMQEVRIAPNRVERFGGMASFILTGITDDNRSAIVSVTPLSPSGYKGVIVIGDEVPPRASSNI